MSDEILPDGRGTALLASVAHAAPATRRILMTAFQDGSIAARAQEAGVEMFVRKPFDPADLLERLSTLLTRR